MTYSSEIFYNVLDLYYLTVTLTTFYMEQNSVHCTMYKVQKSYYCIQIIYAVSFVCTLKHYFYCSLDLKLNYCMTVTPRSNQFNIFRNSFDS